MDKIKMLNLINIGERMGSDIPGIYALWKKQGLETPVMEESFDPARTVLSLSLPISPFLSPEPAIETPY